MKKTTYTCDRCEEEISRDTDWIMDMGFIEVSVRTLSAINSIAVKYHLHNKCWAEIRDTMKSGSEHADPG